MSYRRCFAVMGLALISSFATAQDGTDRPRDFEYRCSFEGKTRSGHHSNERPSLKCQVRGFACVDELNTNCANKSVPFEIKCSDGFALRQENSVIGFEGRTLWINADNLTDYFEPEQKDLRFATLRVQDFANIRRDQGIVRKGTTLMYAGAEGKVSRLDGACKFKGSYGNAEDR